MLPVLWLPASSDENKDRTRHGLAIDLMETVVLLLLPLSFFSAIVNAFVWRHALSAVAGLAWQLVRILVN
jgi:hypothetical protein